MGQSNLPTVLAVNLGALVIFLVATPLLSGAFILHFTQKAKIGNFTYWHCAKICFSSSCTGQLVLVLLGFLIQVQLAHDVIKWLVLVAVQLLMIPLLLRNFSRLALLIEGGAILLSNSIAYGVYHFFLLSVTP